MSWYSDDPRAEELAPIANIVGFSVDAILFACDVLYETPSYVGDEPGDVIAEARDCTAAELCRAVPEYARNLFGTEAQSALREFGILTSDDLGRLIFTLVDSGLLTALPEDRPEDFVGLCRFVCDP
jgi:uncharacterized repeat protein (TIGR04138 family)